ncbi:hypothetical protein EBB07_22725 [Paenibacillaceae bacterium]|nr:hypothetical protein EBB07_22725 [Paenibacillaceae bacterium]
MRATETGIEAEVYFALFDRDIEVFIGEGVTEEYANRCAAYLNALSEEVISELCLASIRYCNDFLDGIGEEEQTFEKPADVLRLVYPNSLNIPEPQNGNEPVIDMELNCDWEIEHGMQWIIRKDKVLYVGAYNGENPWGDFSEKDEWNYASI